MIEAEQWFPGKEITGVNVDYRSNEATIVTLEGVMVVSPSDWVITGVKGERYPCKDEIFKMTYDPVE